MSPAMIMFPALLVLFVPVSGVDVNPIAKVVSMISKLQQDVIAEGREEQKMYTEFSEMCSDRSRGLHQEIKSAKALSQELQATIEEATAKVTVLEEKIGDVGSEASDSESELKKASAMRKKESADFKEAEKELLKTTSTIERAIAIIEREGAKASLAQVDNMQSVAQVLQTMVEASEVDSSDAMKVAALVQNSNNAKDTEEGQSDEDESQSAEQSNGASAQAKSSTIVETLEGLLEKSQAQLAEAREGETKAQNAFDLIQQSLNDKIRTLNAEMADSKKSNAATKEQKAVAQGNLEATKKDLAEDIKDLEALHHECLDKATSFEESTSSRNEELKALALAKKIVVESTGGAADQSYALAQTPSFLQMKAKAKTSSSTASDAVHVVRKLAMDVHSQALLDLTNKMRAVIERSASNGGDPFDKVKNMIESMIAKMQKEAEADATKKAYCDKEMGETQINKDDKETSVEQLSTQIDVAESASKTLKGEVANLKKELGDLARTQAEMGKLRMEEKAIYRKNKPLMEQGLEGVKTALKVLRDYYAQDEKASGGGAAGGIVGMLEVVESDFSKGIAAMTSEEESAQSQYDAVTNQNNVDKAAKEQDAKYKGAEHVSLDKSVAELKADRNGVNDELSAVVEYFASVKKECVAKPDTYEEKKKRRDAEIAGLKSAMETLTGEALLQRSTSHKTLRGSVTLDSSE